MLIFCYRCCSPTPILDADQHRHIRIIHPVSIIVCAKCVLNNGKCPLLTAIHTAMNSSYKRTLGYFSQSRIICDTQTIRDYCVCNKSKTLGDRRTRCNQRVPVQEMPRDKAYVHLRSSSIWKNWFFRVKTIPNTVLSGEEEVGRTSFSNEIHTAMWAWYPPLLLSWFNIREMHCLIMIIVSHTRVDAIETTNYAAPLRDILSSLSSLEDLNVDLPNFNGSEINLPVPPSAQLNVVWDCFS